MYNLLSVVLNNYVIKQIAVKSIHKLILFIEQKYKIEKSICNFIKQEITCVPRTGSEIYNVFFKL